MSSFITRLMRRIVSALVLGLLAAHACGAQPVATVSLALGQAWLVNPQGQRRPAAENAALSVGEAVETSATGHVHLRFEDGATVAVRPASVLRVVDYRDPALNGAVRYQLERGSVRSITGRYGESDRTRFRLNTPIAAIGISGTDFAVSVDDDRLRAVVFKGGIIAAPFDAQCRPDDLGPCSGPRALALGAQPGVMLELRRGDPAPNLVPADGSLAAHGAAARPLAASAPLTAAVADASTPGDALTQATATAALQPGQQPAALYWARWTHAPAWPGDRDLPAAGSIDSAYERVAENARYALYRLTPAEPTPAGAVRLSLADSLAHLVQTQRVVPARVLGGTLTLDFAARRFDTQLTLSAEPTGAVPMAARGAIAADGSFSLVEIQSRISGAWAGGAAGPGAAYIFEHATAQGMFTGITSWR